jgi:hypothetical protein
LAYPERQDVAVLSRRDRSRPKEDKTAGFAAHFVAICGGVRQPTTGEWGVNPRVVFRFISWYYLHAFVALVSLLTRLTRLPGEGSDGLFFGGPGKRGHK